MILISTVGQPELAEEVSPAAQRHSFARHFQPGIFRG
jgi:hypothetical protein